MHISRPNVVNLVMRPNLKLRGSKQVGKMFIWGPSSLEIDDDDDDDGDSDDGDDDDGDDDDDDDGGGGDDNGDDNGDDGDDGDDDGDDDCDETILMCLVFQPITSDLLIGDTKNMKSLGLHSNYYSNYIEITHEYI